MGCKPGFGTRLVMHGIALVVVLVMAASARAQTSVTIPDEVVAVADEAGVDSLDLLGAVFSTGLGPREYLIGVGELADPTPPPVLACGWPICGGLGQRIFCVEGIESTHGLHMWNPAGWPPPYFNEHAQGWLGWLPSTAWAWGVTIGNRASEWDGARRMMATLTVSQLGRQFYGFGAGIC